MPLSDPNSWLWRRLRRRTDHRNLVGHNLAACDGLGYVFSLRFVAVGFDLSAQVKTPLSRSKSTETF